ncbi:hypothetical protein BY996DRAFT_789555 [Phakopsora pachyrhizi]|nr:hypothetical protein BY996DRAFT_789555 [Phakopsora pachyrhizi]
MPDDLLKEGRKFFTDYSSKISEKDKLTHAQRSRDRDRDLSHYFDEEMKQYMAKQGTDLWVIWISVLRPLKHKMERLSEMNRDLVHKSASNRDWDKLWSDHYRVATQGAKRDLTNLYHIFS